MSRKRRLDTLKSISELQENHMIEARLPPLRFLPNGRSSTRPAAVS